MSNDQVAHAISGAAAGGLTAALTYPLITLTTRAQTTASHSSMSALEAAKLVIEKEGVGALYGGLNSALTGMIASNFVYYYFYEGIKAKVISAAVAGAGMSTAQNMVAGTLAGAATTFATNPIWVVNTRMMVDDSKTTRETLKSILEKEGPEALFSGIGPALLLVVNPVITYTFFDQVKQAIERRRRMGPLDTYLLGAVSKIVATTVTYPLITIKARLQLGNKDAKKENAKDAEPVLVRLRKMLAALSFTDLYRGWTIKVVQSALQSAFLFLLKDQIYDLVKLFLQLVAKTLAARSSRVALKV